MGKNAHSYGQGNKEGGGDSAMKKRKLNYRFHNPNTAEVTANYLVKILVEVNAKKVEKAIEIAMERQVEELECKKGHPA